MKNKYGIIQKIFAVVVLLLILNFFFACGIYYFEREAQPEGFGSVRAAMWYVFITLTTIGYGEIYPITFGGRLFSGLTMITGSLIGLICFIWIIWGILKVFLKKSGWELRKIERQENRENQNSGF